MNDEDEVCAIGEVLVCESIVCLCVCCMCLYTCPCVPMNTFVHILVSAVSVSQ